MPGVKGNRRCDRRVPPNVNWVTPGRQLRDYPPQVLVLTIDGSINVDATVGLLVVLVRGLGPLSCDVSARPAHRTLMTSSHPAHAASSHATRRARRDCQAISFMQNAAPSVIASRPFQAR